jgi:hypothetical protein
MIDLFNIPNSQQEIKIFYANGGAWQTWQKPRKCNYVYIICIGGGGGGAGGLFNVRYSPGGASGAISRTLFNSQQLPDTLYIQVGLGGLGGTSGQVGSNGLRSFVMLQQATALISNNALQTSGNGNAVGGQITGANSAGETILTQAGATFLTLSNFLGTAGVTSIGSTTLTVGPDITPFSSQLVTQGGAGGGGNTAIVNNGASILSSSISPLISGGLGSNSGVGGRGDDGITSFKPFFSLGGAGGGNSTVGNGGNGGNGGIGSGGGGGGGFNSGFSGGVGGRGGDGLVIIISF